MRHRSKTKSMRVVLRLIVGLTTSLFVLSFSNALNAEGFTLHKGRSWKAKHVKCGDTLIDGHFELTGNLTCSENPAITIIGPAKLDLKGYTLSGDEGNNVCIRIEGNGAKVWNGTVMNCREGIVIEESDRNKLINVRARKNKRRGFRIQKSSENLLTNCLAEENGRRGFSIEENGDDNVLAWCVSKNNGQQGFKIEVGDSNKIFHSKAIANCRDGIEIQVGEDNLIINNLVEENGNIQSCGIFGNPEEPSDDYYYKPWYYAGIDVLSGSEYNEIKRNRAGCNLGCVGSDDLPCTARERDFWDENVDANGNPDSNNEWENNSITCKNAMPEYSPNPDD